MTDKAATPKSYPTLSAAKDDIMDVVARRLAASPGGTVRLTALAYKLAAFVELIEQVAASNTIDRSRLDITLYLPEADFVRTLPAPSAEAAKTFAGDAGQIEKQKARINEVFGNVAYVPYWHLPVAYGWIIDDAEFFVGFVTWDADGQTFRIAANPCYHLKGGDPLVAELRAWFLNRRAVFDQWAALGPAKG